MAKLRIMAVCGFGLGSSMILRLKIDEVLKKHGIKADTFCADVTTAPGEKFDIVFTSKEIKDIFKKVDQPVIVIENFLSIPEIEEKGLPTIQKLAGQ